MGALDGKVALVTGGAGGLGKAICAALAAEGASVIVGFNRSSAQAEAVARSLPSSSGRHVALSVPVTDSGALATLAQRIEDDFGRCDILVNCAGTTRYVPHEQLDDLDDDLIDDILATNVRGPFAALRALCHLLADTGDGLVVNVSSIAARTAMGSNVMYCASKAAVDNMTLSLARALAPAIRVVSVAPGLVATDFVHHMDASWATAQAQRTPLGRLATPQEVAQAVVAAAGLKFSTGIVIPVDGGRALG